MKAMDAVRANDSSGVAAALVSFSHNIRAIGNILERMDEHCSPKGKQCADFLQEMRSYMPGSHRAFLKKMESVVNIREYAESTSIAEVTEAYNLAVKELELFRGVHIQVVSRFIIIPSRQKSPNTHPGLNLAVASSNTEL
ncbi:putative indoleamine 2,3-dioxygenase pyrrole 2,3-dioxygenase [Diplocarpon rosae]|nr:putative indoleamine 2,3-dioxygenase pyrrole 2,3-dioxygenase [Diplocarpon rosae]